MRRICGFCDQPFQTKDSYAQAGKYRFCDNKCRVASGYNSGPRNTNAKLSWQDVVTMREGYVFRKTPMHKIATAYGISSRQVWTILKRQQWKVD